MKNKYSLLDVFKEESYNKRIMLFAFVVQIVLFLYNLFYGQMHMDEVMLMLNARSIAESGADILGEKLPVYFDTWLFGGQSPLPTYITAVVIRVFGYHLWLARLPMLLLSMATLVFCNRLLKSILNNTALVNISITLVALQPARIANSVWVLDCAYFTLFFIIGVYYLNKVITSERRQHFNIVCAMVFFAAACYSYMTSVIIIPIFLLVYYLVAIKNRKITFTKSVLSALILTVLVLPIILFGFVQLDLIDDFSFIGISISKMQHYTRHEDIILFSDFNQFAVNLMGAFLIVLLPDFSFVMGYYYDNAKGGLGYFSYGHILSVLFIVLTFVTFMHMLRKNDLKKLNVNTAAFFKAYIVTYVIYVLSIDYNINCLHRYSVFFILFNIVSGIGAYYFIKGNFKFGKLFNTALVTILLSVCVILTSVSVYNFANVSSSSTMTVSFDNAFAYVEENGIDELCCVSDDKVFKTRVSVYSRYRYYDSLDEFMPLDKELYNDMYDVEHSNNPIKNDASLKFSDTNDANETTILIDSETYDKHADKFSEDYDLHDFGCLKILTKN